MTADQIRSPFGFVVPPFVLRAPGGENPVPVSEEAFQTFIDATSSKFGVPKEKVERLYRQEMESLLPVAKIRDFLAVVVASRVRTLLWRGDSEI